MEHEEAVRLAEKYFSNIPEKSSQAGIENFPSLNYDRVFTVVG